MSVAITGSVKGSTNLLNDKLVVTIVDFLSVIIERLVKSSSVPLSKEEKVSLLLNAHNSEVTETYGKNIGDILSTTMKLDSLRNEDITNKLNRVYELLNNNLYDTEDSPELSDELYHDVKLHNKNGAYQTVFGLDVLPEYRCNGVAAQLMNYFINDF